MPNLQDYRQTRTDWKIHLGDLLEKIGKRFDGEFDVRLRILSLDAWDRPEHLTEYGDILAYAEKNVDRRGTQILILMTGKDDETALAEGQWMDAGAAHYLGNCIIVGGDELLLHELGHLFGAIDYPPGDPRYDVETIYSYQYTDRTETIDPENRARINRYKYRLFW